MLSTEPQSSPASTNSSGNSPGSRLKSKISRSGWSTLSRSHGQTGRVRQRRPSRGCKPERGAAAVAGRGRVGNYPERADVGTGHRGSGQRAGQLLEVINEVAQPKVEQATADEIFLGQTGLDARRTRQPVLGRGTNGRSPRWPDVGCGIRPVFGGQRRRPGQWQRPGQGAEAGACPTSRRRTAGSRGFAGHLSHVPRGWPCPAENLGAASRALERAEAAQKELDRLGRAGESRTGHATRTSRLWRQAEELWDQAMAAERAWKLTRSAFEFFTPEGRFNDRQQAQAVVAAAWPT